MIIREARESDLAFIYSTWLRGQYHGSAYFSFIDKDYYFKEYAKIITNLLSTSTIMVTCLEEDDDVIIGYLVYNTDTVHWAYVKQVWRNKGVANKMFLFCSSVFSSGMTDASKEILVKKGLTYRPILGFNK